MVKRNLFNLGEPINTKLVQQLAGGHIFLNYTIRRYKKYVQYAEKHSRLSQAILTRDYVVVELVLTSIKNSYILARAILIMVTGVRNVVRGEVEEESQVTGIFFCLWRSILRVMGMGDIEDQCRKVDRLCVYCWEWGLNEIANCPIGKFTRWATA